MQTPWWRSDAPLRAVVGFPPSANQQVASDLNCAAAPPDASTPTAVRLAYHQRLQVKFDRGASLNQPSTLSVTETPAS
jgi:hypothetical protein